MAHESPSYHIYKFCYKMHNTINYSDEYLSTSNITKPNPNENLMLLSFQYKQSYL